MTAFFLSMFLLQGTQASAWSAVTALPTGSAIRVDLDAGSVEGTLVSVTDDALALTIGGRDTSLNRAGIKAVRKRLGSSHRGRNALIGFAAGVVGGLIWQQAACKGNMCMAEASVAYTIPLEAIGTIAGVLAPSQAWIMVYRR